MDFTSPEVIQSRSSKVAIPTTTFNRTFPSFQAFQAYKLSHSTLPSLPSTSKMSSVNVCTQAQLDAAMDAIWGDLEARYNTIEDVKARLTLELWGVPAPVASPVAEPLKIKVPKETKVKLTKEERSAAAKARYAALSDEDKAKRLAKRAATIAAKSAAPAVVVEAPAMPSEAEVEEALRQAEEANHADAVKAAAEILAAAEPKPVAKRDPKVKMTKEERSQAAKARYAAMSDEAKAAIRERMIKGRQAAKAAAV